MTTGLVRSLWFRLAPLMVLGTLAACGGGGDSSTGPGAVASVSVNVGTVTMTAIGATQAVTAVAKDAKGATVTSASIVWTVDNAAIATIAGSGSSAVITAISPGATVAHARVGAIGADIPVQVLGVRSMQVNPSNASIRAGDTQNFSVTFDADAGVSQAVTWTSGDAAVATVSATGVVTGVTAGTTTIRATSVADPRISSTANVTVAPARGVVINPNAVSIATGQTQALVAIVNIENGLNTAVTWRTSSSAIASVSQAGVVTGVAFGTATITAVSVADSTLRATATVNVVPIIRNLTVSPTSATLFINNTQTLTATVTAEGSLSTAVTWRSSNATVATVSASGVVTGVAVGSATITALSVVDTTKRATAAITVASRPISVAIVQRVVGLNPGTSTTLTANVAADPGVSTAVQWTSATPAVATISQAGLVSAITAGTSLITARSAVDNSKFDTVTVTVVPRLASTWSSTRLNGILYDDLVSVAAFNPTTAFAINSINGGASGGDIYRWNGVSWTLSVSGSTFGTQFLSVQGSAANNVIAVGTNGIIARWDGSAWSPMTSGTTRTLRSVWVESPTSAFAVGANGTALKLTGSSWTVTNSGSTAQLNGVWSTGGIAYAAGASGELLRYNGTAWAKQTVNFGDDFLAVSGTSSTNVTAVGNFGGIVQFDGTNWNLIDSNGVLDNLYTVNGTSANGGRMYIGGDNGLYQLDAGVVTATSSPYPVSVYGVSVDPSGTVWISGQRGSIQRLSGSAWETLNFAPDLLDVWSTSATNAWAVGEYGFIYRWNGATWTKQTSPSLANLYSIWASSATDAFAGGDNGTMLRWNGTTWLPMSLPSTARVFAIWGSASNAVFAATDIGEILRFNGTSWSLQTTAPGGATLLSLYGVSGSEVYATGTGGLVMRFNGSSWSTMSSPDAVTTLFGVWMSGSNNIIAVGADQNATAGFAFNYTGTSWQTMGLNSAKSLTSIWGPSVFDLYATGDLGTMLRYNGTGWQTVSTGTTDLLWAVTGAPDASGGAFAVGINTTMVSGSSTGASQRMAGLLSNVSRADLNPSAAARHDRKASGPAATGAARRDRAIRGSVGALRASTRAAARRAAAARGR